MTMGRAIRNGAVATLALGIALAAAGPALAQDADSPVLQVNQIMQGQFAQEGEPQVFMLRLDAEDAVQVDVSGLPGAELPDPQIKVIDPATGNVVAEDDDGGDELNSRVVLYGEDAKLYRIEVRELGDTKGRFEIAVRPAMFSRGEPVEIAIGENMRGTIMPGQELDFLFDAKRGQQVSIIMRAAGESGIDTRLQLFRMDGMKARQLADDDDGGPGLGSLIRQVIAEDGQYRIRASLVGSDGGDYLLRLDDGARLLQAQTRPLALDKTTELSLDENAPLTDDGARPFQLFTLGDAPVRLAGRGCDLSVTMTSSDFDSFLEIGFLTPLGFAPLQSDDDGAGELNARIEYILAPLAREREWLGRLAVRANSLNGETGAYRLVMEPGGTCADSAD